MWEGIGLREHVVANALQTLRVSLALQEASVLGKRARFDAFEGRSERQSELNAVGQIAKRKCRLV